MNYKSDQRYHGRAAPGVEVVVEEPAVLGPESEVGTGGAAELAERGPHLAGHGGDPEEGGEEPILGEEPEYLTERRVGEDI